MREPRREIDRMGDPYETAIASGKVDDRAALRVANVSILTADGPSAFAHSPG